MEKLKKAKQYKGKKTILKVKKKKETKKKKEEKRNTCTKLKRNVNKQLK